MALYKFSIIIIIQYGTVVGKTNTFLGMIHDQHSWRFSEKSNRNNE